MDSDFRRFRFDDDQTVVDVCACAFTAVKRMFAFLFNVQCGHAMLHVFRAGLRMK